jgi:hypothetical protein
MLKESEMSDADLLGFLFGMLGGQIGVLIWYYIFSK